MFSTFGETQLKSRRPSRYPGGCAKIKRRGRVIRTKTFRTKTAAREWARRVESDHELELELQDPALRQTFNELCAAYRDNWNGVDHHRLFQVRWWQDRLGPYKLSDVSVNAD